MKKQNLVFLSFLFFLTAPFALGTGIGVTPATISIEDALELQTYERTITLYNPTPTDMEVVIKVGPGFEEWVSESEHTFLIPKNSSHRYTLHLVVPSYIGEGAYQTVLIFAPKEASSQGFGLIGEIGVPITITVTKDNIVKGYISRALVKDAQVDSVAEFSLWFVNSGNVVAAPNVELLFTGPDNIEERFTIALETAYPGEEHQNYIYWNTTGLLAGNYSVSFTSSLDGKVIDTRELPFQLLARPSLARSVELAQRETDGKPDGTMVKDQGLEAVTGNVVSLRSFIPTPISAGIFLLIIVIIAGILMLSKMKGKEES